eukprot:TRINITY_DN123_c0_g1_i3.p1 TRINITY_DN123_c0_g1~~TRINITY_DN123_c0_g1_i3.p1  ORF type:complete len:297 (+),score=51.28 TRINITY_DN123_c0_g1_i3:43-933(+)
MNDQCFEIYFSIILVFSKSINKILLAVYQSYSSKMFKIITVIALALASNHVYGDEPTYSMVTSKKSVHYKPATIKVVEEEKPSPKPALIKKEKDVKPSPKPVVIKKDVDQMDDKKKKEIAKPVTIKIVDTPKGGGKKDDKKKEEDKEDRECFTIAEVASETEELSIFYAALEAAGFLDTVNDPEFVATVLAPTNAAFEALIEAFNATAEVVLADPQLANILRYHAIPEAALLAEDLEDGAVVTTILGQELTVDLSDGVTFVGSGSSAKVVVADVVACKAIIHVIDTVLIPDFEAIA